MQHAYVQTHWLLIGDFNAYFSKEEMMGSSHIPFSSYLWFREFVNLCQLLDIGFTGKRFTWERIVVKERLDKALVSSSWHIVYSEVALHHLPRIKSDHRLVLHYLFGSPPSPTITHPFHFQATWLTHVGFKQVVKDN